ncbi:hypothetical protein [Peptoniphilus asaccharolyticus]
MNSKKLFKRSMFLNMLFVILVSLSIIVVMNYTREEVHIQSFEKDNSSYLSEKNGNYVSSFRNMYLNDLEIVTIGNGENLTIKFTDNKDNEVTDSVTIKAGESKEIKLSKLLTFDDSINVKVVFNDSLKDNVTIVAKKAGLH